MTALIDSISNKFYLTFVVQNRYIFFTEGLMVTLILTLGSFVFGTLFGFVMSGCKYSKHKFWRRFAKIVNGLLVQIPTVVILLLCAYVVFAESSLSNLWIAIIALSLKTGAYMTDIFYSAVASVIDGEIEAARSLGLSRRKAFWSIVFPQAFRNALPVYKNQFVTTLQETSIVGYIALQDLTRASDIVTSRTLDAMFGLIAISIAYLLIGAIGTSLLSLLGREKHLGGDANDKN